MPIGIFKKSGFNMKRYLKLTAFIVAVAISFCLVFAACGGDDRDPQNQNNQNNQTNQNNGGENGDGRVELSGDVLVVYFSATNNTERVAGYIADITGATTFELVPETPYTAADLNYGNANSRVSKEHDDESLRNVALADATPDDWESYETVFVGYPIWWGIAAWVVNGFIAANDFTGKTVVPFCTSASSGIGNSDKLLEELAGDGNWIAGKRFSSSASKSAVEQWIESLDID